MLFSAKRDHFKHYCKSRPLAAGHRTANKLLPLPVSVWRRKLTYVSGSASYQSPLWCLVVSRTAGGVPLDSGGHLVLKVSARDPERWWIPKTLEHAWRRNSTVRNNYKKKSPRREEKMWHTLDVSSSCSVDRTMQTRLLVFSSSSRPWTFWPALITFNRPRQ